MAYPRRRQFAISLRRRLGIRVVGRLQKLSRLRFWCRIWSSSLPKLRLHVKLGDISSRMLSFCEYRFRERGRQAFPSILGRRACPKRHSTWSLRWTCSSIWLIRSALWNRCIAAWSLAATFMDASVQRKERLDHNTLCGISNQSLPIRRLEL